MYSYPPCPPQAIPPYKVHFGVYTPLNKMDCEYTLKDNDMAIAVFSEMQKIITKYLSNSIENTK